jgi:ribose 5-phosphate isomerase B
LNYQQKKMALTIALASDHGGYEMKAFIKEKLKKEGYEVVDYGTDSTDSVDYPDFIHPLAKAVNEEKYLRGIIICGSGNGAQMTANKYKNVRAGLAWNTEQAVLTRQHNNANVLSLPGRFVPFEEAWSMVKGFLTTDFEGGRHALRVSKIADIVE